ncbi:hypothetical protein ACFW9L_40415 [Streptomyces sp. NPDC059517]|uniref:hypothetical protein n=1 Tax=Streptomyces sp. NPDC059517 TaxID=3346855 RepID=UPI0036749AD5
MSSATSGPTQPFITKLREVVEAEEAKRVRADSAVAEAERILHEALHAQRVATERHTAAVSTAEAAEAYAAGFAPTAAQATSKDDAQPDSPAAPADPPRAQERSLLQLITDVMNVGEVIPLTEIYERVRPLRPETSKGSTRGSLTHLCQRGIVESVGKALYRLQVIPADYRRHA